MRSQFLVPLLVGMLSSLSIVCEAPAQTSAEEAVEIKFDRFRNYTDVRYPSIDQAEKRARNHLTPTWLAGFDGQTPIKPPRVLSLTFRRINSSWQYLRCHDVAMLADGIPVQLPPAEHSSSAGRSSVIEDITVRVSFDTARKLSGSQLVEFKICNTEGRFSKADMQGLRGVIKAITPQ